MDERKGPADKAQDGPKSDPPKPPPTPQGGIKETLESILVAFILAFIFRSFVIEAFVIPTGSMAPTLMGAHAHYVCPDCGHEWDVGFSTNSSSDDNMEVPSFWPGSGNKQSALRDVTYCPNCNYAVANFDPQTHRPLPVPVYYGDRILVLKYSYLLQPPRRWDVVVFKTPADPGSFHYNTNFIKRLIGTPGESIMVLDGDIYVSNDPQEKPDSQKTWRVQSKPRVAQEALWRPVYDNDQHPIRLKSGRPSPWQQPWAQQQGSGWPTADPGQTFKFQNPNGSGTLAFNPQANPAQSYFHDWLGYDQTDTTQGQNVVSDLKLDLWYHRDDAPQANPQPLRLRLSKLDHTFVAEIYPGEARLIHVLPSGQQTEIGRATMPASSDARHIEFSNADYHVVLRVDGADLVQSTPEQFSPDIPALLQMQREQRFPMPRVAIEASNQTCTISHLNLMRDVCYTQSIQNISQLMWGNPGPVAGGTPDSNGSPVHLGADEYFVMGDNSYESYDARFWHDRSTNELLTNEGLDFQSGRVPGRFMLGKAFFVYWPAAFRLFGDHSPGFIPNFGKMRFIH